MSLTATAFEPPARHIGQMFFQRVAELGERPFVRWREGDDLKELTWRDFGARVRRLMIALRRRGLVPGDTVAMIGNNSVEWLCADLATLAAGFPNVIVQPGYRTACSSNCSPMPAVAPRS
jgi:long-subunit acyl-CoA synthetase (AMP-forming)